MRITVIKLSKFLSREESFGNNFISKPCITIEIAGVYKQVKRGSKNNSIILNYAMYNRVRNAVLYAWSLV